MCTIYRPTLRETFRYGGRMSAVQQALLAQKIAAGSAGIAFDAVSSGSRTLGGAFNNLTVAHTCTGSQLALFVSVGNIANVAQTISSVTYNGVAPTATLWNTDTSSGTEAKNAGYIWINPSTGANNIVATLSGNGVGYLAIAATSWTGVNQTGTVGNSWRTPIAGDGSSDPTGIVVNTAQNGDVVLDAISCFNGAGVLSPNQTQRVRLDPLEGTSYAFGSQSAAATGSTTMSWSNNGGFWTGQAFALIPA